MVVYNGELNRDGDWIVFMSVRIPLVNRDRRTLRSNRYTLIMVVETGESLYRVEPVSQLVFTILM